jgi:NDP-sugar pyrophosphorylase family protein
MESVPELSFVVANGDVLTDTRYGELLDFHEKHRAAATMAVRLYEWQHPFGVVEMQGIDIVGFEEKPMSRSHINAGFYALSPEALTFLEHGESCDMPTLFERLRAGKKRTVAYPMHEPWLDIGQPGDLAKAETAGG